MDFFALSLGKALCDASTAIVYAARCTAPLSHAPDRLRLARDRGCSHRVQCEQARSAALSRLTLREDRAGAELRVRGSSRFHSDHRMASGRSAVWFVDLHYLFNSLLGLGPGACETSLSWC